MESIRVTFFPMVAIQPLETVASMWRTIAGAEPEETVSKASAAVHQVHGPYAAGHLVAVAAPGRIDVAYTVNPVIPADPLMGGMIQPVRDSLGPLQPALAGFKDRLGQVFDAAPPIHRLALGCVVLHRVATRQDGYRLLQPLLPRLDLDPEGSADFLYQINRPTKSRLGDLDGLVINRLGKWSVQATALFPLVIGFPPSPQPVVPQYAGRVEVDINTAVDFGRELPQSAIRPLGGELIDYAIELGTKGDPR